MKLPEPVDFSDVPSHAHVWGYTEAQMRDMYLQGIAEAANRAQIAMLGIPYHWTKRVVEAICDLKEQVNDADQ